MQVKYLRSKFSIFLTWILISAFCFVIFVIFYFPNLAKLNQLRQANRELETKIQKLKEQIQYLDLKIKTIKSDSTFYEGLARQELGVVKEGEIVIDIQE